MHRIDTTTAVPNAHGTGKSGFTDGTVPTVAPTQLNASWFDDIQEEICNVIEGESVALVAGARQLTTALQRLAGQSVGALATSRWTPRTTPNALAYTGMCWSSDLGLFVGVAPLGTGGQDFIRSADGITWTVATTIPVTAHQWWTAAWSPSLALFAAISQDGASLTKCFATSPDGITWTGHDGPNINASNLSSICWSPSQAVFVAVGGGGTYTSADGTTWLARTNATANCLSVCWSPTANGTGLFCAVNAAGAITTSPDGITWTIRYASSPRTWKSVCWSPELSIFCVVANDNTTAYAITTSKDGITWTGQVIAGSLIRAWTSVAWSPAFCMFVAVASNGTQNSQIIVSNDGVNWSPRTSSSVRQWQAVAWADGLSMFAAIAQDGTTSNQIMTSL